MVPSHGAPVDRGGPSHDEHGTLTPTPRGVPGLEGLSSKPPAKMIRGKGGADGRVYHSTSLFVLRPYHFPRRLAILILEANFFEPFIAVTILRNCLGRFANQLRIGPYRAEVLFAEQPHPVQLLLRPGVLKEGLAKLEERLLKELV